MKKLFSFAAASLITLTSFGPIASAAELRVDVNNIQTVTGSLYISVYQDELGFKTNSNFVKREKVIVDKNRLDINMGDLPAGEYAVRIYQDVNNNGQMDFHGMLPNEPYGSSGSSNNSKEVAPPSFSDAKFTLDKARTISIDLLK